MVRIQFVKSRIFVNKKFVLDDFVGLVVFEGFFLILKLVKNKFI